MEVETAENWSICCLTGFPTRKSGVRSWSTIPRSCFRSTGRRPGAANAIAQGAQQWFYSGRTEAGTRCATEARATLSPSSRCMMRLDRWRTTDLAEKPGESFDASPQARSKFRTSFAGVLLAVVVSSLDQNIVSTALPSIAGELGGVAYLSWIVTAFMLTSTISAPIYGKLSDMYGKRRLFAVSMSIFLVSSVLCTIVGSLPQLIAARALQGFGAGGL